MPILVVDVLGLLANCVDVCGGVCGDVCVVGVGEGVGEGVCVDQGVALDLVV